MSSIQPINMKPIRQNHMYLNSLWQIENENRKNEIENRKSKIENRKSIIENRKKNFSQSAIQILIIFQN